MKYFSHFVFLWILFLCLNTNALTYKSERLKKAVDVLDMRISPDSILPEQTMELTAHDGRNVCVRTNSMGEIEHIGIPLFDETMRALQPSPVYDFLEYAVLNWKYKINPNQLYLSKVIFKQGTWTTLLNGKLDKCACSIENREDKLYVVTWRQDDKDIAVVGIPVEYELLNNDTRRNMERVFINELTRDVHAIVKPEPVALSEDSLSIYGTEGLFVTTGQSYIIDLLNQNVYYKLSTVYETEEAVVGNEHAIITTEKVLPVVVNDPEFPAESFANLMMCDNSAVPDVTLELEFHLSDYHRQHVTMPLSRFRAFCRQQGCNLYFACDGMNNGTMRGVCFVSNLPNGYNHLLSLRIPVEQLTLAVPTVSADVYLYIPPIEKSKLFGTAPTKKSGVKFNLP